MVFEAHRQRQYACELLFSTVVELTALVSRELRPSLHAACLPWKGTCRATLVSLTGSGAVRTA